MRIEEAIQGIDGIKQIVSTSSEGMGSVMVEVELGADARRVLDDIKTRVDAIDTFPEETEKPIIREMIGRNQVIDLAVSGSADEQSLKTAADRIRNDLSAIPSISLVEISSARPYEISIEVSETALRRHGLTFDDVADAVRRSSLDLPGGSVRSESGEILLRTIGPGVPRQRIRKSRPAHARRRDASRARRGGDGRRRFRRDRPVRALRRRSHRADLRLPDRRPERARHRRPRPRIRRADPTDAARGHLAHGLAGPVDDTPGPAHDHAPERAGRVRAGVPGARPVSGAAARVLGQPRHSHFVPRRHRADARARRDGERHLAVRLHPGTGHRGRRRHHRRRERLCASGRARRGDARRDRGQQGDCDTGRLRRADDRGGVHAAAVRTGPYGQDLPRHSAGGHPLPAVLADRITVDPAGPPLAHPQAPPQRAAASLPAVCRERPEAVHPARIPAGARAVPPVALHDCRHRRVNADRDRRDGARRLDEFPFLPGDRGRLHGRLAHHAAGYARFRNGSSGTQAGARRRARAARPAGGNRAGLFPAYLRRDRRPADGCPRGRPDGGHDQRIRRAPRRGHRRAAAVAGSRLVERTDRQPLARGHRFDTRGRGSRFQRIDHGAG